MKHLSGIVAHHVVNINKHGIATIIMPSGPVQRKMTSKPFSNYSVDTVRIAGEKYLIDSRIDITLI